MAAAARVRRLHFGMLVVTNAIVLHAFDYLETSRILRLVTREAGVQSVLAKGARRSRGRFGSGIDLFAEGEAQIHIKPTRELHTLATFDVTRSRAGLALEMDRFMAASAVAELVLRLGGGEPNLSSYDNVAATLDALAQAPVDDVVATTLGGLWQIVAASGFAPSLDRCSNCHGPLVVDAPVTFAHAAGGALCDTCARLAPGNRVVPAAARETIGGWLAGEPQPNIRGTEARAHQRLFREFVSEHLADNRHLRAFAAWESDLTAAVRVNSP